MEDIRPSTVDRRKNRRRGLDGSNHIRACETRRSHLEDGGFHTPYKSVLPE